MVVATGLEPKGLFVAGERLVVGAGVDRHLIGGDADSILDRVGARQHDSAQGMAAGRGIDFDEPGFVREQRISHRLALRHFPIMRIEPRQMAEPLRRCLEFGRNVVVCHPSLIGDVLPPPHRHAVLFAQTDRLGERVVFRQRVDRASRPLGVIPSKGVVRAEDRRVFRRIDRHAAAIDTQVDLPDAPLGRFLDALFVDLERVIFLVAVLRVVEHIIDEVDRARHQQPTGLRPGRRAVATDLARKRVGWLGGSRRHCCQQDRTHGRHKPHATAPVSHGKLVRPATSPSFGTLIAQRVHTRPDPLVDCFTTLHERRGRWQGTGFRALGMRRHSDGITNRCRHVKCFWGERVSCGLCASRLPGEIGDEPAVVRNRIGGPVKHTGFTRLVS